MGDNIPSQPFIPSLRNRGPYMDNREYEKIKIVLGDICNRLFSAGEDRFGTKKWHVLRVFPIPLHSYNLSPIHQDTQGKL